MKRGGETKVNGDHAESRPELEVRSGVPETTQRRLVECDYAVSNPSA